MAGEGAQTGEPAANAEDPGAASHEPRECMPCRGTGQVISNLGGTPSSVTCPWCSGTGSRQAGIDAQAHWREREGEDGGSANEGVRSAGEDGEAAADGTPSVEDT
jgi:hypothetical protein